jgi:hypothetical protein
MFSERTTRDMLDGDPLGIKEISQGMRKLEEWGMDIYVTA